jgi:hypothetical protein
VAVNDTVHPVLFVGNPTFVIRVFKLQKYFMSSQKRKKSTDNPMLKATSEHSSRKDVMIKSYQRTEQSLVRRAMDDAGSTKDNTNAVFPWAKGVGDNQVSRKNALL